MCGVIGIISNKPVASELYQGLFTLQHRGQDAAGILTLNGNGVRISKSTGLVDEVFHPENLAELDGSMGIAQVRYPTVGLVRKEDAQPFFINYPYGIGIVHNGNIVNFHELAEDLCTRGGRLLTTSSDVEIILNIFAEELQNADPGIKTGQRCFKALHGLMQRVNGAYSVITVIANKGMLAFRDPHAIRPLIMGKK